MAEVIGDNTIPNGLSANVMRELLQSKNMLKNKDDMYIGTGIQENGVYKTGILSGPSKGGLVLAGANVGSGVDVQYKSALDILNEDLTIGDSDGIHIGKSAETSNGGVAIGMFAEAKNDGTTSYGNYAKSLGKYSAAIGNLANATAEYAYQLGPGENSVANSLKFINTQIVDGTGNVNATKINGMLSTEIFESDGKTAKNSTLAQNVVNGSIIKDSFKTPKQLVSHSICIKASNFSMEVAVLGVNNSDPYGNNFLNFCKDYKTTSVVRAEHLVVSGYLDRESDGSGSYINIKQAMKMEKISGGTEASFQYKIDFIGVKYNSATNRTEPVFLSLYIRNGDDGTKAYKNIAPTTGEPVYTMYDLDYSVTGV